MRNQVALVQFGRRLVLGVRNSDLDKQHILYNRTVCNPKSVAEEMRAITLPITIGEGL
jgi:hypothetical protein